MARIGGGEFDGDHDRTYWIVVDGARSGMIHVEDLGDGNPLFDLRLRSDHRGQGLGTATVQVAHRHAVRRVPGPQPHRGDHPPGQRRHATGSRQVRLHQRGALPPGVAVRERHALRLHRLWHPPQRLGDGRDDASRLGRRPVTAAHLVGRHGRCVVRPTWLLPSQLPRRALPDQRQCIAAPSRIASCRSSEQWIWLSGPPDALTSWTWERATAAFSWHCWTHSLPTLLAGPTPLPSRFDPDRRSFRRTSPGRRFPRPG